MAQCLGPSKHSHLGCGFPRGGPLHLWPSAWLALFSQVTACSGSMFDSVVWVCSTRLALLLCRAVAVLRVGPAVGMIETYGSTGTDVRSLL